MVTILKHKPPIIKSSNYQIFDPDLTEAELFELLSKKRYRKIGEGFSAHVFGATDMSIAIKIFPPLINTLRLNVEHPEEISSISKNSLVRFADVLTSRWKKHDSIQWIRRKAKLIIALAMNVYNTETSKISDELNIKGYEILIQKGLTKGLPTKVISNCLTKLPININRFLKDCYDMPEKIVLQKRFGKEDLLMNKLNTFAKTGDISKCKTMIKDAMDYEIFLWERGVVDTDSSFNILDNLIMLPNGRLQLHDANDITDSKPIAFWFVQEKERDIVETLKHIDNMGIAQFLNRVCCGGICETARKLYGILPEQNRENIIALYLNLSKKILSEKVLTEKWDVACT